MWACLCLRARLACFVCVYVCVCVCVCVCCVCVFTLLPQSFSDNDFKVLFFFLCCRCAAGSIGLTNSLLYQLWGVPLPLEDYTHTCNPSPLPYRETGVPVEEDYPWSNVAAICGRQHPICVLHHTRCDGSLNIVIIIVLLFIVVVVIIQESWRAHASVRCRRVVAVAKAAGMYLVSPLHACRPPRLHARHVREEVPSSKGKQSNINSVLC
jgi:hypothetical protein